MPQIPASDLFIESFHDLVADIVRHGHTHYWLDGGRASTKTSVIAESVVVLIIDRHDANAVVMRKVGNTLRDSVVVEIRKAMSRMGVSGLFSFNKTSMDYTYMPTWSAHRVPRLR